MSLNFDVAFYNWIKILPPTTLFTNVNIYIYIYILLWKGEARRRKIIKLSRLKEQLGPTIHQLKRSTIKIIQIVKLRKAAPPRSVERL